MFLQNYWYAAALSAEIADKPFGRTICGAPIVFFRAANGAIAALEDRCAHRHAPLSLGCVRDGEIECAYHGLRYDASGTCTHVPGQKNVPPRARVRRYPAAERWGWIWVWIGDAEAADPATIPHFPWFDSPDWDGFHKYFHVKGGTQLFSIDQQPYLQGFLAVSLLDSHVNFGTELPTKPVLTGPAIVDASNVDQTLAGVKLGAR